MSRVTEAFDFPRKLHGAVLGKGGATIKSIESGSGARVQLPARDAPDGEPLQLIGTPESIRKALELIHAATGTKPTPKLGLTTAAPGVASAVLSVATAAVAKATPGPNASLPGNKAKAIAFVDGEQKLYVPTSAFGDLIGPKGATVRAIEESSGAKIKIPRAGDSEVAVRVVGSGAQIGAAVVAIEKVIGFAPSTKPIVARLLAIPAASIGKLIGEGGRALRQLEADSQCNVTMPRREATDRRVLLEGNEDAIAAAIKLISAAIGQDVSVDNDAEAARAYGGVTAHAPEPTAAELGDVARAIEKLWALDDAARLEPGKEITLNLQTAVAAYDAKDAAHEKFFSKVDSAIFSSPTFRTFVSLLDNYESSTAHAEFMSAEEKTETWAFLHAVCASAPMQYAFDWCKAHGGPADDVAWKKVLFDLWFGVYSRGGVASSSAFEHVFVGEINDGAVTGLHNWIQFYLQEKAGHVDYRGYVVPHRRGQPVSKATGKEPVLSLKFAWGNEVKPVSTFLLGTTPEFELALFTMAFYSKKDLIVVDFGGYEIEITCHRFATQAGERIGTAYCEVKQ